MYLGCQLADASAIGTTVLQIKEIPERPSELDGKLCLFGVAEGVQEAVIRKRFGVFGVVVDYKLGAGSTPTIVQFSTHGEALAAKRAATELSDLCASIDTLYNERSYDGRTGGQGLDDDTGRGWCASL